ncbi:PaaI family thioesterase [Cribrihabitans marinus]|uniref:PaaI family thioesterase n=1 Tax=Cribrihabitans marinus TaxID=1227549 RepID=UPI00313FF3D2
MPGQADPRPAPDTEAGHQEDGQRDDRPRARADDPARRAARARREFRRLGAGAGSERDRGRSRRRDPAHADGRAPGAGGRHRLGTGAGGLGRHRDGAGRDRPCRRPRLFATTDLHTQFLRPGTGRAILCRAHVVRAGRALVFARAEMSDADSAKLVATATASFYAA